MDQPARRRVNPPPPPESGQPAPTSPRATVPPPPGGAQVEQPAASPRRLSFDDISKPSFKAREGDKLVVSYPEVTLPLQLKFAMVRVGGASYERTLVPGEDPLEVYKDTFTFLKDATSVAAAQLISTWAGEVAKAINGGKPVERQEGVGR